MICTRIEQCKEISYQPKETLIDPKGCDSRYLVENTERKAYERIDFERCVTTLNGARCDYGLITDTSIYYIELKGSDVNYGIEQLFSTINQTEQCFNNKSKKARLIVSRFPAPKVTKNTKAYKDLVKKVKNNLIVKEKTYTEKI